MDILINTPWWVYILFAVLMAIGLKAVKPRTIPFQRLILLPGVFMLWNIAWLAERVQGHFSLFLFWVVGLIVGAFIGWQTVLSWKIQVDRDRKLISLPGTWSTVIFIFLVFATRYFFVYQYKAYPASASHLFTADALISGVITGIFLGRVFEIYRKYKTYEKS